jgi:predicted transcriptional regulator
MTQKMHTKDEKLIICLYETASDSGDLYAPFNRYEIGAKIGLHPKGIDTICKLLLQANFVKKSGPIDIFLTKNGEELVLRLLRE